jgi:hypothetical protein
MIPLKISISGPGGCMDFVLLAIKEALEREGIPVSVHEQDGYPPDHPNALPPGTTLNMMRADNMERDLSLLRYYAEKGIDPTQYPHSMFNYDGRANYEVGIEVKHLPWGG